MGLSHMLVDFLMLIPFAGAIIMWVKMVRHKCKKSDNT